MLLKLVQFPAVRETIFVTIMYDMAASKPPYSLFHLCKSFHYHGIVVWFTLFPAHHRAKSIFFILFTHIIEPIVLIEFWFISRISSRKLYFISGTSSKSIYSILFYFPQIIEPSLFISFYLFPAHHRENSIYLVLFYFMHIFEPILLI